MLLRRNFPDTAYWNPSVVTDADGNAKVTLTLPDSLTTWRMTARGLSTDTRVGQSVEDLVSTKPLLVRHLVALLRPDAGTEVRDFLRHSVLGQGFGLRREPGSRAPHAARARRSAAWAASR